MQRKFVRRGKACLKVTAAGEAGVAIVHDYLTQRGGAERVVLNIASSFPGAPIFTSLYDRATTFPDFASLGVRTLRLDRVGLLRRRHRLAFPFLAPSFSRLGLDYPVVFCSSSGWAHAAHTSGRKVVYCHTPARWLYQTRRYLGDANTWKRIAVGAAAIPLRAWDQRAAHTAHRYLVNSSAVRDRVAAIYGIEAELLPPPPGLTVSGPIDSVPDIDDGYFLCISRLLPYKNVAEVVQAFAQLPAHRLVVAGTGPLLGSLKSIAPPNVAFIGAVSEPQLRKLYMSCAAVVAASHEDFGLTPIEGFAFGKPTAALRWGGYLDTVEEGRTGVFFDAPRPDLIARAIVELSKSHFRIDDLRSRAEHFSEARFTTRLQAIAQEERLA